MAITTPLGYNPSASPISGTDQVGTLAVGIYNKALTSGQISGIYNATKSRYGL